MIIGYSPSLSVFYAIVVTFVLSFLRKETALMPAKLVKALADGSIGALNAATTCACAGIVVGIVTLTGLGLKFSSIVISYAGGSLLLTAIYTSLIVWIIGLAVPVTPPTIICAVIAAPALIKLGVPDYAAHMFHLLLCGAVRGVTRRRRFRRSRPPPSPVAIPTRPRCNPGNTRCRRSCAVRVRARPAGRWPLAVDPEGRVMDRYCRDHDQDDPSACWRCGICPELWRCDKIQRSSAACFCYRDWLLCFPSLIEAIIEGIIGRDISYTYVPGLIIGLGVVLWQARTRAPRAAGAHDIVNEGIEETKMKKTTAILAMTLWLVFAGAAHAQQKTMSIGTGGTGWRLLSARRRRCQRGCRRAFPTCRPPPRGHRRLGRQPQTDRRRKMRAWLHHGRCRARCAQR